MVYDVKGRVGQWQRPVPGMARPFVFRSTRDSCHRWAQLLGATGHVPGLARLRCQCYVARNMAFAAIYSG